MQVYLTRNAFVGVTASFIVLLSVYLIGDAGYILPFILLPLSLCAIAVFGNRRGIAVAENAILFITTIISVVLVFYILMFDAVEVKAYLELATYGERRFVIYTGGLMLCGFLFGGGASLATSKPLPKRLCEQIDFPAVRNKIIVFYCMAWGALIINFAVYFLFYHGRPYVDVHSSGGFMAGLLMKSIYLTYGALINILIFESHGSRQRIRLFLLSLGFIVLYAIFFQLRSPILFYILLIVFFRGGSVGLGRMSFYFAMMVVVFLTIALFRDNTLASNGVWNAMSGMLISLGDFADTMIFVKDYVEENGVLYGMGMLGSFFGFVEPLVNHYARSVAPEYFEEGGGFGFFVISDFMANFGILGGTAALFVSGWCLMSLQLRREKYLQNVVLAVVFASAFAIVRNDFGSTFRGVVYTIIATCMARSVVTFLGGSRFNAKG